MVYKAVNTGWNIGTFIGNPAPSSTFNGVGNLGHAARITYSIGEVIQTGQ